MRDAPGRGGDAGLGGQAFGQVLVHGDGAGQVAGAGIGDAHQVQGGLDPAVLPAGAWRARKAASAPAPELQHSGAELALALPAPPGLDLREVGGGVVHPPPRLGPGGPRRGPPARRTSPPGRNRGPPGPSGGPGSAVASAIMTPEDRDTFRSGLSPPAMTTIFIDRSSFFPSFSLLRYARGSRRDTSLDSFSHTERYFITGMEKSQPRPAGRRKSGIDKSGGM